MKCEKCHDTGKRYLGNSENYGPLYSEMLDCGFCDLATERAEFNKRLKEAGSMSVEDAAWWGRQESAKLAEQYKQQRDSLLEFMENAPVESGVCCCGDEMERHGNPMDCGHSPVDQWDWSVTCWRRDIDKFDKNLTDHPA